MPVCEGQQSLMEQSDVSSHAPFSVSSSIEPTDETQTQSFQLVTWTLDMVFAVFNTFFVSQWLVTLTILGK